MSCCERIHPAAVIAAGAAVAGAVALAVRGFLYEPWEIEVSRHDLTVPDLPAGWRGRTLAHLTDLHWGDPYSPRVFDRAIELVRELRPDLLCITGDFVTRSGSEAQPALQRLAPLVQEFRTIAVTGDHDYNRWNRVRGELDERLAELGVTFLNNEAIILDGGLRVAGTTPCTRFVDNADLNAALSPLDGASPHILLTHGPDLIEQAARRGVPVVLCGHTHGGQVVVPGFGPPITHSRVDRRYASGWSSLGSTRMYTSRGVASHSGLRLFCLPEIALFRLVPR